MRDYFQIAGELWTGVIVAFLLLAVAHYGYGKWLAYQHKRRLQRMEKAIMDAIAKSTVYGAGFVLWDGKEAKVAGVRDDFPRPMGVNPPSSKMITTWDELADSLKTDPFNIRPLLSGKGWIKESRFHLDAENDQAAIDALVGKETADE